MNASAAYHRHMKRRVAQLGRPLPHNCEITMSRLSIISNHVPASFNLQKDLDFKTCEGVGEFVELLERLGYTTKQSFSSNWENERLTVGFDMELINYIRN